MFDAVTCRSIFFSFDTDYMEEETTRMSVVVSVLLLSHIHVATVTCVSNEMAFQQVPNLKRLTIKYLNEIYIKPLTYKIAVLHYQPFCPRLAGGSQTYMSLIG